jgi:MtrB/PioB family decaheme-associated outer membrane protein
MRASRQQRAVSVAPPALACALTALLPVLASSQGTVDQRVLEREVEIGLGYLDDAEFRYGRYTGLVSPGLEPWFEFRLRSQPVWDSGETAWWQAEGTRLGQDARSLTLAVGQYGRQRLSLGFAQIPRYQSDSASTPYLVSGTGFLTLPAGWETTGNTTANLPSLGTGLEDVNLRERRTRMTLGYQRELAETWQFNADYRHERKEGRRARGGTTGNTGGNARAALLPVPIDFTTEVVDLAVTRAGSRSTTALSYSGSFFRNAVPSVSWQSAFGEHPQWAAGTGHPSGVGRLSLEPDNSFHQLSLAGVYALRSATRITVGLALGTMLQDEPFLPYTVNPLLTVSEPLPRSSLDGQVDITRFNVGVSARPAQALQVNASYRYEDRDDRTPRDAYQLIRSDSENQRAAELARLNRPYSLREHRWQADVGYRITRGLRVQGGYRYLEQQRDFSEIDRSREHRYSAGLRVSALQPLALSVDLLHARRSVGEYIGNRPLIDTRVPGTVGEDEFENHPLLRKYYLADRDRDGVRLRADLPVGASASFGVSASHHRDDYRNSVFGLTRATMRTATLDGAFSPAENLQLTAFYTWDRHTSDQAARSFNATPAQAADPERNWRVAGRDRFDTIGTTLDIAGLERWWDWLARRSDGRPVPAGLEAVYADSHGAIDVGAGPALVTAELPALRTKLNFYRLHASWPLRNDAQLRFALEHERYRSRDFGYDGVIPGTIPNVLDLGHESPGYSVNWIVVSYRARF